MLAKGGSRNGAMRRGTSKTLVTVTEGNSVPFAVLKMALDLSNSSRSEISVSTFTYTVKNFDSDWTWAVFQEGLRSPRGDIIKPGHRTGFKNTNISVG